MFQGKRLVTRGVADSIPFEVQMFLWALVNDLVENTAVETDYLQVFELAGEDGKQCIIHRQENPPYQVVYQFGKVGIPLQYKLYVIDDGSHCTILLCDEY